LFHDSSEEKVSKTIIFNQIDLHLAEDTEERKTFNHEDRKNSKVLEGHDRAGWLGRLGCGNL
jgi:hypothetical protein